MITVGLNILVVPDGFAETGPTTPSQRRVRLSLAVSPRRVDAHYKGATVDLANWPAEIAALKDRFRVLTGAVQGAATTNADNRTLNDLRVGGLGQPDRAPQFATGLGSGANLLWRRLFGPDPQIDANLAAVLDVIDQGGVNPMPTEDVVVGGARTAELHRAVDGLTASAVAATMAGRLNKDLGFLKPDEVVSAHFDATRPGREWWRRQHASWTGQDEGGGKAMAHRLAAQESRLGALLCSAGPMPNLSASNLTSARSIGDAARLFSDRVLDPAYWLTGLGSGPDEAIAPQVDRTALAEEMHRLALSNQPCAGPDPSLTPPDPIEVAARRYSAIMGQPTLAKYLGLIVDIEISEAALAGAGPRAVTVDTLTDPALPIGDSAIWTTYRLDADIFGPASRAPTVWREDGLLNLQSPVAGGNAPRFVLICDDVNQIASELASISTEAAADNQSNDAFALPPRQAQGIALIDNDRLYHEGQVKARRDVVTAISQRNATSPPSQRQPHVRDLEDLLQGVRIDTYLTAPGEAQSPAPQNPDRWRTLMGRAVTFGGDVPTTFLDAIGDLHHREDGLVAPMTRTSSEKIDGKWRVEHHDTLFTWHGESLAVPALSERLPVAPGTADPPDRWGQYVWPDPAEDLSISREVDLPDKPGTGERDRRPAPLRIGRGYWFGARQVLTNGCSIPLARAARRYGPEKIHLGEAGRPYVFRRCLEIRAPDVLLDGRDPRLVTSARMPKGEGIEDLVVRAPGGQTARYINAPAVPFELCEQHGEFDARLPTGAFQVEPAKLLLDADGGYPVALDKGWAFTVGTDGAAEGLKNRGAVLMFDRDAPAASKDERLPRTPVFPDPLAQKLRARLLDHAKAADAPELDRPIAFWPAGGAAAAAKPVILELLGRSANQLPNGRYRLSSAGLSTDPTRPFDILRVELAQGETADLELWGDSDAAKLIVDHHVVNAALSRLAEASDGSVGGAVGAARARFEPARSLARVQAGGPLGLVQNSRRLRVTHAVQKPLRAPAFVPPKPARGVKSRNPVPAIDVHAISLTPTGPTVRADGRSASFFRTYAEGQAGKPQWDWPSVQGGSTTFFVGKVATHQLTTGKLRCEATWTEHGPAHFKLNPADGAWSYNPPPQAARLFQIEAEAPVRAQFDQPVDLMKDDSDQYRELSHAFVDGRARRLTLKLIATSRFTEFFDSGNFDEPSQEAEIWTRCTFRPPPVEVESVLPLFKWTKKVFGNDRVVFTRECAVRVMLKPDWFASGEGERLGLIFSDRVTPAGPTPACKFDQIGRFGALVTRSGADPIHLTAADDGVLTPSDFRGGEATPGLKAYLAAPPAGEEAEAVTVYSYPVNRPDATCPFPYCDVQLNPGASYFPFIQLGLVRHQPHSVETLELSYPIAHFVQIPPARTVEVKFTSKRKFDVIVKGVGYAPSAATDPAPPVLNVSVHEWVDPDHVPRYQTTVAWEPVTLAVAHLAPKISGMQLTWKTEGLKLPIDRRDPTASYVVRVEEVELIASRTSAVPVERSPLMSRTIRLSERWVQTDTDETD